MRKRTSLYWLLPAAAGLALIVVAVLLSSASPGGPVVPSAQARSPCELRVQKDGSRVEGDGIIFQRQAVTGIASSGDEIEYTITVTDVGGDCEGNRIQVVDQLPEGLTCEGSSVQAPPGGYQYLVEGCDLKGAGFAVKGGDQVTLTGDPLPPGGEVVLTLLVSDNSDEDCVTNRACAEAGQENTPLVNGTCDEVEVCQPRHPRTPTTPTPTVTNTPVPPTATPYVPRPTATAKPLATLAPPQTGTGSDKGGWSPLTLALGIAGASLLLVSGAALAKKRIR